MEDLNMLPGASLLASIEAIQNVRGIIAGFFRKADEAREQASESQESAYHNLSLALCYEAQGGAMRNVLHFLFTKEAIDSLPEVEPLSPWDGTPYPSRWDPIQRMSQES